jgi:hypothetical protein
MLCTILYRDENYEFCTISEFSDFAENLLINKRVFSISVKISSSSEEISKELQKLCNRLNIKLIVDSDSSPEATGQVIKFLGATAIGGVQGAAAGFFIGRFLEEISNHVGGAKALEKYLENLLGGFDINVGGVTFVASLVNALISGAVAYSTLKEVNVKINFLNEFKEYKGLIFQIRPSEKK